MRKYEKALHHLKMSNLQDGCSLSSKKILQWIFAWPDHSPSATAICYHAALYDDDSNELFKFENRYLNEISNIPVALRYERKSIDSQAFLLKTIQTSWHYGLHSLSGYNKDPQAANEDFENASQSMQKLNFTEPLSPESEKILDNFIFMIKSSNEYWFDRIPQMKKSFECFVEKIEAAKNYFKTKKQPIPAYLETEDYKKCLKIYSKRKEMAYLVEEPLIPFRFKTAHDTEELYNTLKENIAFDTHFKEDKTPKNNPSIPSFSIPPLTKEEERFEKAIKNELQLLTGDMEIAKTQDSAHIDYEIHDAETLIHNLELVDSILLNRCKELSQEMLRRANRGVDPVQQYIGKKPVVSKKKLVDAFLSHAVFSLKELNPHLTTSQAEELLNMTGDYLKLTVEQRRIKKALTYLKEKSAKPSSMQKATALLQSVVSPKYDPAQYPIFLVFEYVSKLNLRDQQIYLLKKLLETQDSDKYVPRLIQLIMGGGKTSILAVILLKAAAKKSHLSCLVTDSSLN